MKNSEMKRRLTRELPYPQLTIRAEKRIESVLAALPERRDADAPGTAGEWEDLPGYEAVAELKKRRPAVTVLKWAAACLAFFVVGLTALDILSPQIAESLPGLGGAFKAVNGFFRGETVDPAPLSEVEYVSLPVEDNGTILTGMTWEGSTVTLTAQVPFMGRVRDSLETKDYFDYTLFGTTAELSVPSTGFPSPFPDPAGGLADSTEVEGEKMEDVDGLHIFYTDPAFADKEGETRNVTWTFRSDVFPEDGRMVLTLYERPVPTEGGIAAYPNRITAQFALDLREKTAASIDLSGEMDFIKATPKEVLYTPRTGDFFNGWYAGGPVLVTYGEAEYVKLVFYQKDVELKSVTEEYHTVPDWDPVGLYYLLDGEILGKRDFILACSRKELEASGKEFTVMDGGFLDESTAVAKHYETETGWFYDAPAYFSNGQGYRRLAFAVPAEVLGLPDDRLLSQYLSEGRLTFNFGSWRGKLPLMEIFPDEDDVAETVRRQRAEAEERYARLCSKNTQDEDETLTFQKHFCLIEPEGSRVTVDENGYCYTVSFYTDLDEGLPWQIRFIGYDWDEETIDPEWEEGYGGQSARKKTGENYSVEIVDLPSESGGGPKWQYTVKFFTDRPVFDPLQTDGTSSEGSPVYFHLWNEETEKLVFCSDDPRRGGKGLAFQNHLSFGANWVMRDPDIFEFGPIMKGPMWTCTLYFYTDTSEDLPWTLQFTAEGVNYEIPLHPADTTIGPPEEYASTVEPWERIASYSNYTLCRRPVDAEWDGGVGTQAKQYYSLTFYHEDGDDSNYDFSGCTWKIVNHETGEIVYDSALHINRKPQAANSPEPAVSQAPADETGDGENGTYDGGSGSYGDGEDESAGGTDETVSHPVPTACPTPGPMPTASPTPGPTPIACPIWAIDSSLKPGDEEPH